MFAYLYITHSETSYPTLTGVILQVARRPGVAIFFSPVTIGWKKQVEATNIQHHDRQRLVHQRRERNPTKKATKDYDFLQPDNDMKHARNPGLT